MAEPLLKFDHVGVVTADVDASIAQFAKMLGASKATRRFDDAGLGVSVRFLKDEGGMVYEMIAPFGDKSPVARTLKSKANLLNQVAYLTPSIELAGSRLREGGSLPLGVPSPAIAFGGANVQFFWSPGGFIIELIEHIAHIHDYTPLV